MNMPMRSVVFVCIARISGHCVICGCALAVACVFSSCSESKEPKNPHLTVTHEMTEISDATIALSEYERHVLALALDFESSRSGVSKDVLIAELMPSDVGITTVMVSYRQPVVGGSCLLCYNDNGELIRILEGQ